MAHTAISVEVWLVLQQDHGLKTLLTTKISEKH